MRLQFTLSGVTLVLHVFFLVLWVAYYSSAHRTPWVKASGLHGLPGIFWFISGLLMLFIVISFRVEDSPYLGERGKAQLERLTAEKFPASRLGENSTETCVICLQEYGLEGQLRKLKCGHFFHDECVTGWILHAALGCPYRCPEEGGHHIRRNSYPIHFHSWEPDAAPLPPPDPTPAPGASSSSAAAASASGAPGQAGSGEGADVDVDWISVGCEIADCEVPPGADVLITLPKSHIGKPASQTPSRQGEEALWNWSNASI